MFMVVLFKIAKSWKQITYPFTDDWINKLKYFHVMGTYSGIKRKEILIHAGTCRRNESQMLIGQVKDETQ